MTTTATLIIGTVLLLQLGASAEEAQQTAAASGTLPFQPAPVALSLAEQTQKVPPPTPKAAAESTSIPDPTVQLQVTKDGQITSAFAGGKALPLLRHGDDEDEHHLISGNVNLADRAARATGTQDSQGNPASLRLICSLICWILLVAVVLIKGPRVAKGEVSVRKSIEEVVDSLLERSGVPSADQWLEMEVLRSGELPSFGPFTMKLLLLGRVTLLEPCLAVAGRLEPIVRPIATKILALIESKLPKGLNRIPRGVIDRGEKLMAWVRKNVPLPGTSTAPGAMEMSEDAKAPLLEEKEEEEKAEKTTTGSTVSSMLSALPQAWASVVPGVAAAEANTDDVPSVPPCRENALVEDDEEVDPVERMARRLERAGQHEVAAQMRQGLLAGGRVPMKEEQPLEKNQTEESSSPIMQEEQDEEQDYMGMCDLQTAFAPPQADRLLLEEDLADEEPDAPMPILSLAEEEEQLQQKASSMQPILCVADQEEHNSEIIQLGGGNPFLVSSAPESCSRIGGAPTTPISNNPFEDLSLLQEAANANPFMDPSLDDIDLNEAFQCRLMPGELEV